MDTTPQAKKFWENVPPEVRVKILNSVWCVAWCKSGGFNLSGMSVKKGNLILEGTCIACGGPVGRLIEGS